MKTLLIGAVLGGWLAAGMVAMAGPPMSVQFGTNVSTKILPARGSHLLSAQAWTNSFVYGQGEYVKTPDNAYYMAIIGGLSTNTYTWPTHRDGLKSGGTNGLTWYYINAKPRLAWMISNYGGTVIWGSIGKAPAELMKGFALKNYSTLSESLMRSTGEDPSVINEEVSFIGTAATNIVTWQEWP